MRQIQQPGSLSPEQLQLFTASLAGRPPEEIRKAKSLYIRNAISEYRALNESVRAMGCLQLCFAVIPFFWPILYMQRRMINAQRRMYAERIQNALDVWRDELQGEEFGLDQLGGGYFRR